MAFVPVGLPDGTSLIAKVDTGAEWCCFNYGYIQRQSADDARLIERRQFLGMGGMQEMDVYYMTVVVCGQHLDVEVAAGPQERNVIGMNLLNEFRSIFAGPDEHIEFVL